MPLLLIGGNLLVSGRWLSPGEVFGVVLLSGAYFLMFYGIVRMVATREKWWMAIAALLILLVVQTLVPLTYWVIYDWFPGLGIYLYRPDVAFELLHFQHRIMGNAMSVFFLAGILAVWHAWKIRQAAVVITYEVLIKAMNRKAVRQEAMRIYPHFVEAVIAKANGQSLFQLKGSGKDYLIRLLGIMRYAYRASQHEQPLVTVAEEWQRTLELVGVIRWKYANPRLVSVEERGTVDHRLLLVPMSMVTLLENCLKHGDLQGDGAIRLRMVWERDGFVFTVGNRKKPLRDPVGTFDPPATGFGLANLSERLHHSGLPVEIRISQDAQTYQVCLLQSAVS